MTAKATLDLAKQVYRLIDKEPATFCPNAGSTYSEKLEGCDKLRRAAASLQRWAEKACNGIERWDAKAKMRLATWTDADEAAKEKAQDRAEKLALTALHLIFAEKLNGLNVEFQRDPRGAMIKLYRKGESSPVLYV